MDLGLSDKVALVTAASKGLGKAAALQFAREGARVAMCARSETIDSAAAEITEETGAEVLAIRADVTKQDDIDAFVQATLGKFGQIDVLILNAGGPPPGTFLSLNVDDWQAAVELTLMSAVRLCYAVVPHMVERGSGSIVAVESVSVKQPVDGLLLSNSIRMSVIGMLKTMANELGPQGIRINSVNPAWTHTGRVDQLMQARAEAAGTTPEEEGVKVTTAVPLGRMGTVEEFGRTVAWLASPAASFVHGHALLFDGGAAKAAL
ncbi:MAG: SDR family oxidoreductase [Anaerolineales bacterium]|jgi:3-oxoacyl-[acyl-carrier protein] reductase|nr:3-oxoacyl-ACP reductase [Anaerolineaceae bacterium]MDP6225499.1 SDR family oxidoreductase [Anaerolineales bacterium]MDP7643881.1 SDR family oxidoreductase [Anaerolineales bacterium]|tara:strand:- start:368 stop:1156 length:789 start_codon:yes stop_codon:yes gene_type:complete